MEKMIWEKPQMNEVVFAANEYVAACGDTGKTYLFECNAGSPYTYTVQGLFGSYEETDDHPYYVYKDDGTQLGYYEETIFGQTYTGYHSYGPCKGKHEASSMDTFIDGWIDNYYTDENERIDVKIWLGPDGDNLHCTTKVDINTWTTGKS